MNIYTPNYDDEIIFSLREWCRDNPINVEELGHEKIPAWNKGIPPSEETRLLCSIASKKKVMTDDLRKRISDGSKGKKHSEATKIKMSKSHTGVGLSDTHKKSLSLSLLKTDHPSRKTVTCSHCGKSGAFIIMPRWHFDNCKFKP